MIGWLDQAAHRQLGFVAAAVIAFAFVLLQLAQLDLLIFLPLLAIALAAALILIRYPWTGFALLVMTVPVQRLGTADAGLPVTLTQIVFPIAIALFAISVFTGRQRVRGHILLLPFAALLTIMTLSALQATSTTASLAELARWIVAFSAFWLAIQIVVGGSARRLVGFVALLALGGVFEASIGVVQSAIGWGPFQVTSGVSRAFGTFGKPNSFAGYLEMTLFPAVVLALWYSGESLRRFRAYRAIRPLGMDPSRDARRGLGRAMLIAASSYAATGIILGGIVASLSRGGWFGVGIGAIATALLLGPVSRLILLILGFAIVGLLIAGGAGLIPEDYRDRISSSVDQVRPFEVSSATITDENFAAAERFAHWQSGLNMYRDHPALGVGAGNYNVRFEEYSVRQTFRISQGHAHNYYIHTLAETGLLGLLAYLTMLASVAALALRVLVAKSAEGTLPRFVVLGAFGSIVAVSAHHLFENLHVLNMGIVISLLWALVIAGHEMWREAESGLSG